MTSGPTSPTLFEQCHGFFYVSLQLKYKDEGDKTNGLASTHNDAIIWTERGDSQLAWPHQFFKDLGWWFGRVWTHDLPLSRPALFQLSKPGDGCNFVLKVFDREEPGARIWLKLMSKLLPKVAIFEKNQYIICSFAPLQKSPKPPLLCEN